MANRYKIWDRQENIRVPRNTEYTPSEWLDLKDMSGVDETLVCGAGRYNGLIFELLSDLKAKCKGIDFEGLTDEESLEKIEWWEDNTDEDGDPIEPEVDLTTYIADTVSDILVMLELMQEG